MKDWYFSSINSILTCTKSCSSPTETLTFYMSICDDICISSEIIIIINVFYINWTLALVVISNKINKTHYLLSIIVNDFMKTVSLCAV